MNDLETRLATARGRLIANRRFFIPAFATAQHTTPIPNHVQFKCCFVDNSTRSVLPPHIFVPDSGKETSSSSTPTPAPAPHRKSHPIASTGVPNRQTPLHNANNHTPSKPSKAFTHPPTADSPNPITQRVVKGRAKRSLQPAFANPDRTKLDNTLFTPSQTRATAAPSVAQSSAPSSSSGSYSPLPRAKRSQQRPKTATPLRSLSHGAVQSATPVFNAQLEAADAAAITAQSSVGHSSPTSSVSVHLELHPPSSTSPNTDSTARRPRFSAQLKPSHEVASTLPTSPPNPAAAIDAVDATDAPSIPSTTVTTSPGSCPTVPLQPDFNSTSSTAPRSPALAQPEVQPIDLAPNRSLASSPLRSMNHQRTPSSSQPARPDTIPLIPAAAQASADSRPPTHALIDTDSSDQSSKSNPDTIHASPESSSSPSVRGQKLSPQPTINAGLTINRLPPVASPTLSPIHGPLATLPSPPPARASGQSSPPGASNDQSLHTSSTPSPSAAALARAIGKRKRVPMSQDEDASDEVESQRDVKRARTDQAAAGPAFATILVGASAAELSKAPAALPVSEPFTAAIVLATLSTTPASTIGPDAHKLMSHVAFATPTHVPSTASAGPPITPCPGPTTHASTPSFLTGISTTTTPSWLAGHVPGSTPAPATSTPSFLASTPRSLATTPSGTGVSAIAALLAKDVSELGGLGGAAATRARRSRAG
ncbi:hypothetical protein BCR44DRAFT_1430593 [Catenaria anguillulae PL171]|uniref:Uncharacterized protein n=1 Tax=Catenaria anguillulae PL171 TaxID=765915 RepID=A0A1Y2HWW6_9FUNG|nr:hypothetical protein BCR44DRAFT_1430593 [Catenaria anguillulae PL171]